MYSLGDFEKLAKDNNITVVYCDCSNRPLKAFIIVIEGEFYIMIDSSAPEEKKREALAYELAHFFTNTFYCANDSEEEKIKKENIADAYMRKELLNYEK